MPETKMGSKGTYDVFYTNIILLLCQASEQEQAASAAILLL